MQAPYRLAYGNGPLPASAPSPLLFRPPGAPFLLLALLLAWPSSFSGLSSNVMPSPSTVLKWHLPCTGGPQCPPPDACSPRPLAPCSQVADRIVHIQGPLHPSGFQVGLVMGSPSRRYGKEGRKVGLFIPLGSLPAEHRASSIPRLRVSAPVR